MKINKINKIGGFFSQIIKNNISFIIILFILLVMLKIYESSHILDEKFKLIKKKKPKPNYQVQEGFTLNNIQNKYQDQEFEDNLNKIRFGKPSLSKKLFKNNKYINNFNQINVKARGFDELEELKYEYQNNSLLSITDKEKEATKWLIKIILKKLSKVDDKILTNFILNYLINHNTIIVKSKEFVEKGYPHTHKNVIVLPKSWFYEIIVKHKLNLETSAFNDQGITLIHELVHIHQRIKPDIYKKLYKKWGFEEPKYIHNINEILKSSRHNPDGNDLKWIWKNYQNHYFMSAVYKNDDNQPDLTEVNYKIYKLNKLDNNIYQNIEPDTIYSNFNDKQNSYLETNTDFQKYFGVSTNHYHPNELAAQYMEFAFYDVINQTQTIRTDAFNIFKKFIKNDLN
tara:strand:+ start:189 stop:1385 length:1197 start_codon:yes stop_codon:yes gene_type:complete